MKTTKEYSEAKALCGHKVKLKLYNNLPFTTAIVAQIKIVIDDEDHEREYHIRPDSKVSIGAAIDYLIKHFEEELK